MPAPPNRHSRGQSLAEFALVAPVMVFLVLIAIDFGRVFFSYIQLNDAAREAAAFAAQSPSDSTGIVNAGNREKNTQGQGGENTVTFTTACMNTSGVTISCIDAATAGGATGSTVRVTAKERFGLLSPFISGFFGNNFQVGASATASILGLAGTGGTPPAPCSPPTLASFSITQNFLKVFVNPAASMPNAGVCAISGYNWDFGDGSTDVGTATGTEHLYPRAGTFTIKLTVTNQGGELSQQQTVTVSDVPPLPSCTVPAANFTFSQSGPGRKSYSFRDASTVTDPVNCPVTDWLWTFDDGEQSNGPNPTHDYTGGKHTTTLVAINRGGRSAPVSKSS